METLQEIKEQELSMKKEVFKEVAESNLNSFINEFNSTLWNYRALNIHLLNKLTEDEVRQLAINFFTKMLAKKSYENQEFYFDKKLTVKF